MVTIVVVIAVEIKYEMQQLPAIIAKCPVNSSDSNFSSINSNSVVHFPLRSENFLSKAHNVLHPGEKSLYSLISATLSIFFFLSNKWKRPLAVDGHPVGADVGQRSRGGAAPRIGWPLNRCGHFRLAAAAGGQLCEYLSGCKCNAIFFSCNFLFSVVGGGRKL